MAFRDLLQTWAVTEDIDAVSNTPQRLTVPPELWDKGWLRENPVATQHLNQLLYIISGAIKEESLVPANDLSDVADTATARTNLGVNTLLEVMNAVYPIGSIYTVAGVATNPAILLGVGTWTAFGEGRVLVGVGTGSVDANGDALTIIDGATGGEVNHQLTQAEMPSHNHTLPSNSSDTSANGFVGDSDGSGTGRAASTGGTGGDTPHNNIQPYLGVRIWRRTS